MIFLLVLLLVFLALVVAVLRGLALTVEGVVKRRRDPALRGLALTCGVLGVTGYLLGALAVAMAWAEASHGNESSPAPVCREANLGPVTTGYRVGYLPLRFDCVLQDGTTRPVVIARWYTPLTVGLTAAAVGISVARRRTSADRADAAHGEPRRSSR